MNIQQHENASYMECIDALCETLDKATSLAYVTRMAHEHQNDESVEECRLATAETMRMIVEQLDKAQSAKDRIHKLYREARV